MQKLLLAGIPKDIDSQPIIIKDEKREGDSNLLKKSDSLERAILLSKDITVFYDFNIFRSVAKFEAAAKNLELNGLGEIGKEKKANSSKSSNCFKKLNINELEKEEQLKLMNILMKYQVSLSAYNNCFSMKRSNSNSLMPDLKKVSDDIDKNDD